MHSEALDKHFKERIMMTVTEVNGCRYCSYFHARVALKAGIYKDEIEEILSGDLKSVPKGELAALFFAQHYAETGGYPQPDAIQCMVDTYGEQKMQSILTNIRAIMVGNAWGNMFDALRLRLKGTPVNGSRFWEEVGVVIGFVWLIPKLLIRKLFSNH